jgi:hypothetical protein
MLIDERVHAYVVEGLGRKQPGRQCGTKNVADELRFFPELLRAIVRFAA